MKSEVTKDDMEIIIKRGRTKSKLKEKIQRIVSLNL